jgi:hypothetical protein
VSVSIAAAMACPRCKRRGLWVSEVCLARLTFPWWTHSCPRCRLDLHDG